MRNSELKRVAGVGVGCIGVLLVGTMTFASQTQPYGELGPWKNTSVDKVMGPVVDLKNDAKNDSQNNLQKNLQILKSRSMSESAGVPIPDEIIQSNLRGVVPSKIGRERHKRSTTGSRKYSSKQKINKKERLGRISKRAHDRRRTSPVKSPLAGVKDQTTYLNYANAHDLVYETPIRTARSASASSEAQFKTPAARVIGPSEPVSRTAKKTPYSHQGSKAVDQVIIESPEDIGLKDEVEAAGSGQSSETYAAQERRDDSYEHIAFASTHKLPSPRTMRKGSVVAGSQMAVGLVEGLEVSTDMARNFGKFYNVSAKAPIIEFPTFIASGFVTFESFRMDQIDSRNPNARVNSWQPGLVTGYEINPDLALFLGGAVRLASRTVPKSFIESGWMQGSRIQSDLGWKYNRNGSKWSENALAVGVTADVSYKLLGVGVTHHWEKFRLGFHYTLNADRQRLLPMLVFQSGITF